MKHDSKIIVIEPEASTQNSEPAKKRDKFTLFCFMLKGWGKQLFSYLIQTTHMTEYLHDNQKKFQHLSLSYILERL